jgi:hypothetical protein
LPDAGAAGTGVAFRAREVRKMFSRLQLYVSAALLAIVEVIGFVVVSSYM